MSSNADLGPSHPTRRKALRLLLTSGGLALAACAAPAASPTVAPTPAPAKPAATQPPAAKPPDKPRPEGSPPPPATKAPTKPQIAKVTLLQSATAVSWGPVYVSRELKFFENESIDLDWQLVTGGALVVTSLTTGEAQFGAATSLDQLTATEKGLGLITVAAATTASTFEIVAGAPFLQRAGLRPSSPLRDKIAALKGARIGVATVAGPPTQLTKFALKTNGLDPEADVEYVVVGIGPPRVAALREARVDLIVGSVPDPQIVEAEGIGAGFIKFGQEIPTFKTFADSTVLVKKDWAEQNASVAERTCRALRRASNLASSEPAKFKEALRAGLSSIAPNILDPSVDQMRSSYGAGAPMTEQMWKNPIEVYVFSGAIKQPLPTAEGTLWTNRYLVNIPPR